MTNPTRQRVGKLVKMSLAFHQLNKMIEAELGLSLVQYHLLVHLRERPGTCPQNLAKAVGMHASTLTQSLKRLAKKDMLFVGPDPKDSRKKLITLTITGKKAVDQFEAEIDPLVCDIESGAP